MNKSFLACVLLSSALCAHKEVVREIAHDIEQSEPTSAEVHLQRLERFKLKTDDHKKIIKSLQKTAKSVTKSWKQEGPVPSTWIDRGLLTVGSFVTLYGLQKLISPARHGGGQNKGQREDSLSIPKSVLGLLVGVAAVYGGVRSVWQRHWHGKAEQVEACLEDALEEVKKG